MIVAHTANCLHLILLEVHIRIKKQQFHHPPLIHPAILEAFTTKEAWVHRLMPFR